MKSIMEIIPEYHLHPRALFLVRKYCCVQIYATRLIKMHPAEIIQSANHMTL